MRIAILIVCIVILSASCSKDYESMELKPGEALVTDNYTADPSAHVFEGKIYIYPSHDIDTGVADSNDGSHYDMKDYRVYSITDFNSPVIDHGSVLKLEDIPWASRQLWAPDAAYKNGKYYFYFPAKDKDGLFRIGVATSDKPDGPFKAQPKPIEGSFSMDPAVFIDDDGAAYMYFGGLWGGQLESWLSGNYYPGALGPKPDEPAIGPRFVRMSDDMLSFDGPIKEISLLDEEGNPIKASDQERWFFEGAWVHKYKNTYYLTYSTGPTHLIVYATSDKPEGPFTYRGILLLPVSGWTTHHSTVEYNGQWYLFYHDSTLSGGKSHLRCVKYSPIKHNSDGTLKLVK
jgi:beta-xylosidase